VLGGFRGGVVGLLREFLGAILLAA